MHHVFNLNALVLTLLMFMSALTVIPALEPEVVREKTNQIEFTAPAPLLDESGNVKLWGWARRAQVTYNRDAIPAELRGRIKEWEHYTIMSPDFTLGLTMAQLGPMTFGSFEVIEYPAGVQPGGFFIKSGSKDVSAFPAHPYGNTTLTVQQNFVTFEFEGTTRKLSFNFTATAKTPAISGTIELRDDPKEDSIAITRPFAEPHHFFYENKIFGMAAKGSAKVGDKTYALPEGKSWAIFDWGRGVWPRECWWFWGQAAGMVGDKRVAFNLGHGYGDDAQGTCNAILIDGKLHKLDTVILDYDKEDRMKPWKLTSNDKRLALDFTPTYRQHVKQNIGLAATELNKIHGKFSGTLTLDDGSKIKVKDLFGFMEHADHVW